MELWQVVLVALGGNATLLLAVAFLGKSLIGNFLTKDLERFKGDLQLAAVEHQIRFSKLYEKRAVVLADLYRLLVIATWETESFVSPIGGGAEEQYRKALDAIAEYYRFFDQHRIYMPEELCPALEDFGRKLRSPTIGFGTYLEFKYPNEATSQEKLKAWLEAWDSVKNVIPQLRSAIEAEFRRLLGASTVRTDEKE
ncbi:MAG: hypothetical protein WB562_18900 [Candidatus Sulfotelmatobacter sp.]